MLGGCTLRDRLARRLGERQVDEVVSVPSRASACIVVFVLGCHGWPAGHGHRRWVCSGTAHEGRWGWSLGGVQRRPAASHR